MILPSALRLTSYVSAIRALHDPGEPALCCLAKPLKHTLDSLIIAWEGNNPSLIEKPLGRNASFAIHEATNLPEALEDPEAAVGYRFLTALDLDPTSLQPVKDTPNPRSTQSSPTVTAGNAAASASASGIDCSPWTTGATLRCT